MRTQASRLCSVVGLLCTFCLLMSVLFAERAYAKDSLQVDVSIDTQVVELGQSFKYTINAATQGRESLQLVRAPDFRPFSVIGQSQMPQFTLRNGTAYHSVTLTYQLRTRRLGEFTITGPQLQAGDAKGEGKALTIKVVEQGKAPKAQGIKAREAPAFIEAALEPKRQPYVGEQLTLAYDLYIDMRRMDAQVQHPSEPSLDGFWIENLSSSSGSRQIIMVDGRPLEKISLRKYALFPLKAGAAKIDPMKIELLTGGFFSPSQKYEVESEPIKLEVQPLPPNAPPGFDEGNIGQWSFVVTTNTLKARQGKSVTIRVSATGTGQPSRLKLPALPESPEQYKISHTEQDNNQELRSDKMGGTKTMSYTIVPLKPGELVIEPLSFSYFDPELGQYQTKQSGQIKIIVEEGDPVAETMAPKQPLKSREESSEQDVLSALRAELRAPDAALSLGEGGGAARAFIGSWPYWVLVALPLLGLLGLLLWPLLKVRMAQESSPSRHKRHVKDSKRELELALSAPPQARYEAIYNALRQYLIEALELPAGALTERELPAKLAKIGATPQQCEDAAQILGQCSRARYAQGTSDDDQASLKVGQRALALIEALEAALKRGKLKRWSQVSGLLLIGTLSAMLAAMAMPATGWAKEPAASPAAKAVEATQGKGAQDKSTTPAKAQDEATLLQSALQAQDARQWAKALKAWEQLRQAHPRDPKLLYNLGTAAIHVGDLAVARLALERAMLYRPNDPRISANLDVAARMIHVRTLERLRGRAQRIGAVDTFATWNLARRLNPPLLGTILLLSLWTLLLCVAARRRMAPSSTREIMGVVMILSITLAIGSGAAWGLRERIMSQTHPAIMMSDEVTLREGPSELASRRLRAPTLLAGMKLNIEERREGWLKIRLPDDSTGWVSSDAVEEIAR